MEGVHIVGSQPECAVPTEKTEVQVPVLRGAVFAVNLRASYWTYSSLRKARPGQMLACSVRYLLRNSGVTGSTEPSKGAPSPLAR